MSEERFDVVVIGSGPAGQKAAIQAAKAGRRALVIESAAAIGGACVHRGTIPSKTLRETALALVGLRQRSGGVVDPTLPEHVQIASLMTRVDAVIRAHEKFLDEQLRRNHVEVWHGRARFVASDAVECEAVDGTRRRAVGSVVVVASGSRPRNPPEVPIDHEHVLDSDSILSMTYLPRSLTVLGAGVIACEYASIFAALGVAVTVVDRGERPLAFLDPELSERFVRAFERAGGRFLGRRSVARVEWNGVDQVETTLEGGETLTSEKLLFALGRVANLDGLDIAAAGLKANQRGLLDVNQHYQTAVDHIYAAGDVIGPPSLAATSMEQGRRAVCHALELPLGPGAELIPLGIYTIPEMAQVGLTEADLAKAGGARVGRARFDELARGQIAAVPDGLLKLVADHSGRLRGVQVIGEGACDLVHIGQVALMAGWTVDRFIDNVFNFPTLAEAYRVAAFEIVKQG